MMSILDDTTVTAKRNGTSLVIGVPIQIDPTSHEEKSYVQGQDTYFVYDCIIEYASAYGLGTTIMLAQEDLLVDEIGIDPITGKPIQYRIKSIPQYLALTNHYEFTVDRRMGVATGASL